MKRLLAYPAGLLLCLFAALAWAVPAAEGAAPVAIPPLAARVTDLTASLGAESLVALEQKLAAFEARKGAQIVVLILPTTQPESIEQFGIRLFDAWQVGRQGVDDGAILLVAWADRRMRIEVGYGLEGGLNDATAKRIIAEVITPRFQQGDLAGGIAAGIDAMIRVVDGEPLPAPGGTEGRAASRRGDLPEALWFGILAAVVIGGSLLRRLFGSLLGSLIAGSISGAIGWLLVGGLLGVIGGVLVGMFLAVFGLDILLSGLLRGGRGGGSLGGRGGGRFGGGGGMGGGGGASGRW